MSTRAQSPRSLAAILSIAAISLASCSGDDAADPHLATYDPSGEGGETALVVATLSLEDGCVYGNDPAMDQTFVPVFPQDKAHSTESGVEFAGTEYEFGSTVTLAGGYIDAAPSCDSAIPSSCESDSYFILNQDQLSLDGPDLE